MPAPIPTYLRSHSGPLIRHTELSAGVEPSDWCGSILCTAGHDRFRIKYFGDILKDGTICDAEDGCQLVKFECSTCDDALVSFDPKLHGYDAEVGNDWLVAGDRSILKIYSCICGGEEFRSIAWVRYPEDIDDDWEGDPGNSFESIVIEVTCSTCSSTIHIVEYETA